jgi:PKD repeat protein
MQRKPGSERALSDSVSIALILLLVVAAAAIVFVVVFGYASLTPKSAYIAMRGVAANTSVGAATLTIFHFEGDPVNINSSLKGDGVAPVSFNLILPGGAGGSVTVSPAITDNTWRSGNTLSIYQDAAGYWVTNDINLRITQATTLGPLVNMQGGNYTINVVDEKAKVLIGAVPVTIAGIGAAGPQYSPGLIANYYSDQSWTTPAATNIAPRVYFADTASGRASDISNWPVGLIGKADHFSVKYSGFVRIDTEADYAFTLSSDDGSWMDLDSTTNFISNGGDHSYASVSATKHLLPGYHPVTIRMYENGGEAVVYLVYKTPAMASPQVVTQLYHIPSTAPAPDFSGTPLAGAPPLAVQFSDASIDATSYTWNFGDGTALSHAKNPLHTYTSAGKFDVSLTATNSFGTTTIKKSGYITAGTFTPGIVALYYGDQGWTTLITTNIASRIHFADTASGRASDVSNWPAAYTGGLVDHFSVKYTGLLRVDTEDDYTFTLSSDDGSWMDLDSTDNFISNGGDHSYASVSATRHLTPGDHPVTVRMYENGGQAVVYLEYRTPSMASSQLVTNLWHG